MTPRHADFERIKGEFENYYCKGTRPCPRGEQEYYSWLKALSLDETLPYGQRAESFQWAKDMISLLKEDETSKYYRILVGFPLASMNNNLYKERDLVAAALSLVGAHPSLNHKDDFWFSPENPLNKWGVLTVTGGKYEDGAAEAILQVPKDAICPICDGAKMTDLIDKHKIVNVSLEGGCALAYDDPHGNHECDGFTFNKKGFSLLTSDVLPGIPLARIFPIESFLPFSKARHKRVKIVGFESMSKKEGDPSTTPAFRPDGTAPDDKFQCPEGQHWSGQAGVCVPDDEPPLQQAHIPEGTGVALGTPAASDDSHKPITPAESLTDKEEADYKAVGEPGDFDACKAALIAKGYDEDRAGAICAAKCQGGEGINHELELATALARASDLDAKLSTEKRERETEAKGLKAALDKKHVEATQERTARVRLEGRVQELTKAKDKYDESMQRWNKDRIELEAQLNKRKTDLTEALDNVTKYKQLLEALQTEHEGVMVKYRESLSTNMALNKKITTLNEETLTLMRKNEELEERLKKAKRLGKNISMKI